MTLAAALAALALIVRGWSLSHPPLWQDEAESAIYARQILDVGYPHDTYLGERLYENRSFIPSGSDKYEFESTNFYGSRLEKNKGWLPHYLMAGTFQLFGAGTWQARAPSVAAAGLTVLVLALLAQQLLPRPWAWLPALLHALNPIAIAYERQARYYSLEVLLVVLSLFLYLRFLQLSTPRRLLLLAATLALLFHTHVVAALIAGVVIVAHWFSLVGWRAAARQGGLPVAVALLLAATLPWMAVVNFPAIWYYQGQDPQLRYLWLGVAAGAFASLWWLSRWLRRHLKLPVTFRWAGSPAMALLATLSLAVLFLTPLLTPAESVAERQFLPLLPVLALMGSALLAQLPQASRRVDAAAGLLLVAGLGGGFFTVLHLDTRQRAALYDVAWVPALTERLRREGGLNGTLVLTDYFQFPLSFYARHPIQLLYPLRCEFLRTYPGKILYLVRPIRPPGSGGPDGPPLEALPYCYAWEQAACGNRLTALRSCLQFRRTCQLEDLSGTAALTCTPPTPYG